PREMPPMAPQNEKPAPAAPDVRPEPRPSPAEAPAGSTLDDDPLAALEAEMANLLGRDVGKPKG
ncbi:hypothetical protein ACIKT0_18455, partial [Hansschlegelia beijingensis]